jgi:alkylation response protein AidB-like acyl-CoA dehydrogenase
MPTGTHDLFYTDDQRMLRANVRRFAEARILPEAARIDREDRFPRALYRELAGLGLFGICLAERFGGAGMDTTSACIAMEEVARASGSMGNAFAIPVEASVFLSEHGTAEQQALIPGILDGSILPATAVTEPDHGSDVAGLRTTAVRDGDHFVINGTKAWVTLGRVADFIMVFARTGTGEGGRSISCFLVEGDRPGLSRGKAEDLLGMHGLEDCMLSFSDVRVPAANMIGAENQAFKTAMRNFNFSRLMMSAMSLGMAVAGFEDAMSYAQQRRQFGQPIFDFQAVQFMLADMSMDIDASRLLIHNAARVFDAGHSAAKEAAHAKLFTTDMAMKHITNALQIHGGNGYSREYRVERLFRDIKLAQIYEGTNQIQRLIIARQIQREFREHA